MTIEERKMAITYADLLSMQELSQHILRMDADELLSPEARHSFAVVCNELDKVMADTRQYMSKHTDFNKETSDGRAGS